MNRLAFVVAGVIVASFAFMQVAANKCGDNEYFDCKNPNCTATCQYEELGECNDECVKGCYCKEGYWKDLESGKCVEMSDCPCPPGRVYRYSNACINRCKKQACTKEAMAGCWCPDDQCENACYQCVPRPQ